MLLTITLSLKGYSNVLHNKYNILFEQNLYVYVNLLLQYKVLLSITLKMCDTKLMV